MIILFSNHKFCRTNKLYYDCLFISLLSFVFHTNPATIPPLEHKIKHRTLNNFIFGKYYSFTYSNSLLNFTFIIYFVYVVLESFYYIAQNVALKNCKQETEIHVC